MALYKGVTVVTKYIIGNLKKKTLTCAAFFTATFLNNGGDFFPKSLGIKLLLFPKTKAPYLKT